MDSCETLPHDHELAEDIYSPEAVNAPSEKAEVCRCKTLVLGDVSSSHEVCALCASQAPSQDNILPAAANTVETIVAPDSDSQVKVPLSSTAALAQDAGSLEGAPRPETQLQPSYEPISDGAMHRAPGEANNKREALEEPPKPPTDTATPAHVSSSAPLAEADGKSGVEEEVREPEAFPQVEEVEDTSASKGSPLPAADDRRRCELQQAAQLVEAKATLDARQGIANKAEGSRPEDDPPNPVDKNCKVNGYALPKEWLQLPYITPQEQNSADGSEPKKRGRKPKAKAEPSKADKGRGRSSKRAIKPSSKDAVPYEEAEPPAKPSRRRKLTPAVEDETRVTKRRTGKKALAEKKVEEAHEGTQRRRTRKRKDEDREREEPAEHPKPPKLRKGRALLAARSANKKQQQGMSNAEDESEHEPRRKGPRKASASRNAEEHVGRKRKRQPQEQPAARTEEQTEKAEKAALRSRKCVAYAKAKRDMIAEGYEPTDPKVIAAGKKAPWLPACLLV